VTTSHVGGLIAGYARKPNQAMASDAVDQVPALAEALRRAWTEGRTVYLCGNGGSAGNAIRLANDLLYGAGVGHGAGLKVEALSANAAVAAGS
jgi:D-sedoheptulose 7-phosphate isomerase